eukprot:749948-Hanusia_phi.AAC.1
MEEWVESYSILVQISSDARQVGEVLLCNLPVGHRVDRHIRVLHGDVCRVLSNSPHLPAGLVGCDRRRLRRHPSGREEGETLLLKDATGRDGPDVPGCGDERAGPYHQVRALLRQEEEVMRPWQRDCSEARAWRYGGLKLDRCL